MHYECNLQQPVFTVTNLDILRVSRPKNYLHSYRAGRTKHGFIYTVSDTLRDTFYADGTTDIDVSAGELIFIPKGSDYTGTYLDENTQIKIVQFDLAAGDLPPYLRHPAKMNLPNAAELMDAFFKPQKAHPFYALSCLYALLWQVDNAYTTLPTRYKRLNAALSQLSEFYWENWPVARYAELCEMSEVSFRRLFREYTGVSPIEYRNDLRLEYARILLQSGEYNVSEASEMAGFTNLSFFIRLYKRKYGHTPKKE